MSDEKQPSQSKPPKSGSGPLITLGLVALLGIAAGAGLYALLAGKGKPNGEVSESAQNAAAHCTLDKAARDRLNAAATGEVAAFQASDRPYSVKDFAFNDREGQPKTFADWDGRTVLFNLWATWCAPCRAEMPHLETLNRELGDETFEVVPVSVDLGDAERPKGFYEDIGLKDIGFFHDPKADILSSLKRQGLAFGLPATLLIGKDGCVLGTLNGPAEWHSEDAKSLIKAAL